MNPIGILVTGVVLLIVMILVLRLNAFIALISTAILVSLLSPGDTALKVHRVAVGFGEVMGSIGIVIALAAVLGKCLMDSGAADRIIRSFLNVLGEKKAAWALMGSGFILSIPAFFDTVFYLLIPLARSMWRKTRKNYMLYILAIVAGAGITHTLVPPTPGPLFMASQFEIDLGLMIGIGLLVGLPTSILSMFVCTIINRFRDLPMRPYSGEPEPEPLPDEHLPPLWLALLPVVLPVILISMNTIAAAVATDTQNTAHRISDITAILGNPNMALLISAVIAMYVLAHQRKLTLKELGDTVHKSLMVGGGMILITAGGGAFGKMLQVSGIKETIEGWVGTGGQGFGITILLMGFAVSSMMKFSLGSGTVAMMTTASMFAAMGLTKDQLGLHPVYLAMAIGSGSLVGDWMNNGGFWVFARMSVLTESECLRSWTILTAALGIIGLGFTLLLAYLMPMA
jgi:GntP family gluconate:H+ symporter